MSRSPILEPVRELTQQIVESANDAEKVIKANSSLKQVLQRIALMGSLHSEQAALVKSNRTSVVSLGVESWLHTNIPFQMAELIQHEVERMQLMNLHIMLQLQRSMLGGQNSPEVMRNSIAPRVLDARGAKNMIIDNVKREAYE